MAAFNAFILILRNAAKFGFVSVIGTIFMYVGKFFISILITAFGFVLAAYWPWVRNQISTPFVPAFTLFLISYTVSSIFLSIFSVASNTIL